MDDRRKIEKKQDLLKQEEKNKKKQLSFSYCSGAFALFGLGSGIVTLVYGVFLLLRSATIEYNFGVFNLFTTSILLIVVGSLVILVVILGVIGAFTDTSNLRLAALVLLFVSFGTLGKNNLS